MAWTRSSDDGDKKYMHNIGEGDLMEGNHLENPEGDRKIGFIKVVNIKSKVVFVSKRVTNHYMKAYSRCRCNASAPRP
jgi:hypothetical protein